MMLYRGGKRRERGGKTAAKKGTRRKESNKNRRKIFSPHEWALFSFSDTDVGMAVYTVYIDIVYCYY